MQPPFLIKPSASKHQVEFKHRMSQTKQHQKIKNKTNVSVAYIFFKHFNNTVRHDNAVKEEVLH